jgi:hypothetical protein
VEDNDTAGERWGVVVETEEQLLCGGGGFMIRPWRMEEDDGRGGTLGCSLFFLFLAGLNPNFNPTLYSYQKKRG